MLVLLEKVIFPRSFKPKNVDSNISPISATFNDGNEDVFGANAYTIWTLKDGNKSARLVMSKAKLIPLLQQGDPYRNELSSAVFAARLKEYILENSGVIFFHEIVSVKLLLIYA